MMGDMFPVELRGARVGLREFRADDAELLYAYATDPKVLEHTHWQIFSLEDAALWIARMNRFALERPRTEYQWAITLTPEDAPVGGARLRIESLDHGRGSIGYVLGGEHWGKGIVTEAMRLVVDFGFRRLNLHRIEALVEPSNERSWRVCERLGMTREGLLREYFLDDDRRADMFIHSILEHEWKGP